MKAYTIPLLVSVLVLGCALGIVSLSDKEDVNASVIRIVSGRDAKTFDQRSRTLGSVAKSHHMTVAELESLIADEIVTQRRLMKQASGGYAPGFHIVKGTAEDRIDANVVRPVDAIMNFDNIEGSTEFHLGGKLDTDKSIYIKPVDVKATELANARLVGYLKAGTYLRGSDYAQTEALRRIERTPGGGSGWTGLTRVFDGYDGLGTIVLEESDYLAEGGVVLVPEGALNTTVGSYPATLSRLKDGSGKTMTHLDWTDKDQHNFSLNIRQTDSASVDLLRNIAESIAKSRK